MKHNPRTSVIAAVTATVFCLGLVAGCSNDDGLDDFHEALDAAETEPTTSQTADASTTSSSSTSTTVAEEADPDYDTLDELWQQLLTATGLPLDERRDALEALDTLATPVLDAAATLPADEETAEAYTYPVYDPQPDGSVSIEDCTLYQPAITGSVPHLHTATAKHDNQGNWTITQFKRGTSDCVPAQIAQPALDGYQAYVDALNTYWNPPNPGHPLINQTLTGELRQRTFERLQRHLSEGRYLVSEVEIAPEVTHINSPERILVTDCLTVKEGSGSFSSNGERNPDIEQPDPGMEIRSEVDMRLEDGTWKATDASGSQVDDCDQAPTPAGLRIIE